jgi:hypothetical protein
LIVVKQPYTKCEHCKHKFNTGLVVQRDPLSNKELLNKLRKPSNQ